MEYKNSRFEKNKDGIVKDVSRATGLKLSVSQDAINVMLKVMKEALANGEDVIVKGFGRFKPKKKAERVGRNPKTGEEHVISARTVVQFSASDHLKGQVNHATAE